MSTPKTPFLIMYLLLCLQYGIATKPLPEKTTTRPKSYNMSWENDVEQPVGIPTNPCGLVDGHPNLVNMSLSLATTTIAQQAAGVRREIAEVIKQVGKRKMCNDNCANLGQFKEYNLCS